MGGKRTSRLDELEVPLQVRGINNIASHMSDESFADAVFVPLPFRQVFVRVHPFCLEQPICELLSSHRPAFGYELVNVQGLIVDNPATPAPLHADLAHQSVVSGLFTHRVSLQPQQERPQWVESRHWLQRSKRVGSGYLPS